MVEPRGSPVGTDQNPKLMLLQLNKTVIKVPPSCLQTALRTKDAAASNSIAD
jgi:hypothetical protein